MRISTTLSSITGCTLRRIALAAALAVVIGATPMVPAFADNDRNDWNDRNDRNDRNRHGDEHDRDQGRGHYHRYPVYVPPPVYRPRYESPGITLFFPIEIH